MELLRIRSQGQPAQAQTSPGDPAFEVGVLGIAISPKEIGGAEHTVVQVMFDDDRPGFDRSLLDTPMTAEVQTPAGDVVARELFDHDEFRQRLHADQSSGANELRGVVLTTAGELPPPYLRLAFLTLAVPETSDCDLVVTRHDRSDLVVAVDGAHAQGTLSDSEHRALRTMIDQRHPHPDAGDH